MSRVASNETLLQEMPPIAPIITRQPERSSRREDQIEDLGYIATIDDYSIQQSGFCCDFAKPLFVCLVFFIAPPLAILWFLCDGCCSLTGRNRFMKYLKACYFSCCCRFDCISNMSLYDAILRYEEDSTLKPKQLIDTIVHNKLMIAIMEELSIQLPDFFFTFFPSGSLRERYGKMLPSTSMLATDYDIMLIPDAISVAKSGNESRKEAFIAEKSQQEHEKGFLWLNLNETFLTQWEKFCLRRFLNEKGCSMLSSSKIVQALKEIIMKSDQIKTVAANYFLHRASDISVTLEQEGPACTVKVQVLKRDQNGCYNTVHHRMLFHADFTLALHCCFWPDEALGFFSDDRRQYWPPQNVIDDIKRINCHVVPKQFNNSLVKMTLEQAEYTRYARNSGLEWRYSFSQAEVFLSDSIPPDARTAFLAFKALNKRYLNKRGHKTKSYALKSILFSQVEAKRPEYWEREDKIVIEEFFLDLMRILKEGYRTKNIPNYWIPELNLIDYLTAYDCQRKFKMCEDILENPKKYVADNWLEYVRCLRLNCCYCGDTGYKRRLFQSGEVADEKIRTPDAWCTCNCDYNNDTCPCGPCSYNPLNLEVY